MTDSLDEEFVKLLKSLHTSKTDIEKPSSFVLPEEPSVIWKPIPYGSTETLANENIIVPQTQLTMLPFSPKTVISQTTDFSETDIFSITGTKVSNLSDYFKELASNKVEVAPMDIKVTPILPNLELDKGNLEMPTNLNTKITQNISPELPKQLNEQALLNNTSHKPSVITAGKPDVKLTNVNEKSLIKTNEKLEFKISKNQYNWLYLAAFVVLIILMFAYIYWFYVKDYKNFLNLKKGEKGLKKNIEESNNEIFNDKNQTQNNESKAFSLENEELIYKEAETLLDEPQKEDLQETQQKEKAEEDYSEEYFEPLEILNTLQTKSEKSKKIIPSRLYFDLSDVDQNEMVPVFQEKERVNLIGTKLSDESPEVNEYAKKREKLLESL